MQVYVPGPVGVWVGSASGVNSPTLLGYGENGVQLSITPTYDQVMSDLGGNQLPFDKLFQGETGQAGTTLTVLNWGIYESVCMARPTTGNTPGVSAFGDLGQLSWGNKASFHLWLRFPYATTFAGALPGMVAGYHFFAAMMVQSQPNFNTSAAKIPVQFDCIRSYNYATGTWSLYDHNMTGTTLPSQGQ